jgi:hypothetical protein
VKSFNDAGCHFEEGQFLMAFYHFGGNLAKLG